MAVLLGIAVFIVGLPIMVIAVCLAFPKPKIRGRE